MCVCVCVCVCVFVCLCVGGHNKTRNPYWLWYPSSKGGSAVPSVAGPATFVYGGWLASQHHVSRGIIPARVCGCTKQKLCVGGVLNKSRRPSRGPAPSRSPGVEKPRPLLFALINPLLPWWEAVGITSASATGKYGHRYFFFQDMSCSFLFASFPVPASPSRPSPSHSLSFSLSFPFLFSLSLSLSLSRARALSLSCKNQLVLTARVLEKGLGFIV